MKRVAGMLVGYARVSTSQQETDLQLVALRRAGVRKIYSEKASGISTRPELQKLLASLKFGDCVVVYKLDRLARSLRDLLTIIERLHACACDFKSLTEPIDTATPAGMLMLQMLGAVAQFERSLIRERSMAGQAAAMARGVRMGRPSTLLDGESEMVLQLWQTGHYTLGGMAHVFDVHPSTIKRVVYGHTRHGMKTSEKKPVVRRA